MDAEGSIDVGRVGQQLRTNLAAVSERHRAGRHVVSRRNPFAFSAGAEEIPSALAATPTPAPAAPRVEGPPLTKPLLTLIGIAEDLVEGGRQRTAIMVDGEDALYFVREGETLENRYRVQRIGEADVQLADVANAAVRVLSLAR